MRLSKNTLNLINAENISVPSVAGLALPEKVLQFGTGVLLRGLPDYFIDKANKKGIFNGRVVVVKSTETNGNDAFDEQDGLYTQWVSGIENGELINQYIINASISRVLVASKEWKTILDLAALQEMQIIISNTTEAGLVLDPNDRIDKGMPLSFPGKLLAFLYARWKYFNGSFDAGMVILPTELLLNNGQLLLQFLNDLTDSNSLDINFKKWLNEANYFCNTLVDRIVPGKLSDEMQKEAFEKLGFEDELMIMSEPFRLWAIESDSKRVKEILAFANADTNMVIVQSIEQFRNLKLRLLNGAHTFSCGLAYLAGFKTVKEAMSNHLFVDFLTTLMKEEIALCLNEEGIDNQVSIEFANSVLERFANPTIEHRWLSITVNYSEKMRTRNIPLIHQYFQKNNKVPEKMTIGFVGYLLFNQHLDLQNNQFYGKFNGLTYKIDDSKSEKLYGNSKNKTIEQFVHLVLTDFSLWGTDLSELNGFEEQVIRLMKNIDQVGVLHFLKAPIKQVVA